MLLGGKLQRETPTALQVNPWAHHVLTRQLRASWRLTRLIGHAFAGLYTLWMVFPRMSPKRQEQTIQNWSAQLLRKAGIAMQLQGQGPVTSTGARLLVVNHISWLDINALHAAAYCQFVSKSEIKTWPLVGPLATAAGTIYLERQSRRDALRVVAHIAQHLTEGRVIAIFPEGTTGDGVSVLPFHANLIQSALVANAPVQPVGLFFSDANGKPSRAPLYLGNETFLGSVWRTLQTTGLVAHVRFGEPQWANGRDRRAWAHDLRNQVIALAQPPRVGAPDGNRTHI